jgi:hypothetical protein
VAECTINSYGGILSSELPVIDIRSAEAQLAEYFRKVPRDPASRPIIRIRGTWKILSREKQGYLSVNLEPSWAQVYGDISMSLYPTRDVQDLIELFWLTIDTRASLVDSFINAVEGWNEEGKKYDRVYFARGVPSPSSMDSYAAAYYSEPIQLYDDLVSAIKASYGFKEVANITPYRRSSLLHGLSELEIAKYRLGKIMDYHKISVNYGHSVSFVAEKVDGFAKVVRWLSDGIVLQQRLNNAIFPIVWPGMAISRVYQQVCGPSVPLPSVM